MVASQSSRSKIAHAPCSIESGKSTSQRRVQRQRCKVRFGINFGLHKPTNHRTEMDASRVLVPVASIKTPAQSLPLALCARREWVARLDLATRSSTERTRESQRRAQNFEFCQWRLSGPAVQPCQSCHSLTRLIWLSSSDRLRLICAFLDPATKRLAFLLSPGPQHDMANRSPPNPWIPRNVAPPRPRPAPFFWPAVVSSMELPVPLDQNPRLPRAVPVPPSRRCCCPDCDILLLLL